MWQTATLLHVALPLQLVETGRSAGTIDGKDYIYIEAMLPPADKVSAKCGPTGFVLLVIVVPNINNTNS